MIGRVFDGCFYRNETVEQLDRCTSAEIERLRYELGLAEEEYRAEAKHSIKLETALKEILRVIGLGHLLGNGHRLREIAQAALSEHGGESDHA